jgi:hypothetical protein
VNVHPFIEAEKAQQRNVKRACELLEVSRAAYYAHRADIPWARQLADEQLTEHIRQAHQASKGRYGAPRIHAELRRRGHRHGKKRVARLMRCAGLRGRVPRRWNKTTVPDPAAAARADLIRRDFTVNTAAVNTRWCGDITYIPTWEGWLYLATVIDIASRRVVGFALTEQLRTELVADALTNAVAARDPAPGVVFHADRGCQGGFNWPSQHPEHWGCGWDDHGVGLRRRQEGRRCGRLAGRQWRGVSIGCGSGRRSRMGCPVRTPLWCVACRRRWGPGGSAKVAACHRSAWPRRRVATCRSPSARRSPCSRPRTAGA